MPMERVDQRIGGGRGHLEVLRWAVAQGCPWDPDECRAEAEASGHEEVVAWIGDWLRPEDIKEPESA